MKIPVFVRMTPAEKMRAMRDRKRGGPAGPSGCKPGTSNRSKVDVLLAMATAMDYHQGQLKKPKGRYDFTDVHEQEYKRAKAMYDKADAVVGLGMACTSEEIEFIETWLDSGHTICA